MPDSQVVVALDIGTTKICALVGELGPDGTLQLSGCGQSASEGLRKGVVVDMAAASKNVREAVDQAERQTGIRVSSVVVGVTGEHVEGMNRRGSLLFTNPDREISEHDVHRVLEQARTVAIPYGREVLHVLPRGFTVDGQSGVRHPEGMTGQRLEVETHIITGASSFVQNVVKSVEMANLVVETVVLEPLATCEAVLTDSERELGVVVADIGGGTTDVAIVTDGAVAHSAIIPVGGSHVTNDLAVGLKTSRTDAERLKRTLGCALSSLVSDDDLIEVPAFEGESNRKTTRRAIADIIEPRMQELYQLIGEEIRRSGLEDRVTSLVLSGGGSLLHGSLELAQVMFRLPVRIGRPRNLGICPELDSPVFATAAGLLQFGAVRKAQEEQEASTARFLQRALEQVRQWLENLLHR